MEFFLKNNNNNNNKRIGPAIRPRARAMVLLPLLFLFTKSNAH